MYGSRISWSILFAVLFRHYGEPKQSIQHIVGRQATRGTNVYVRACAHAFLEDAYENGCVVAFGQYETDLRRYFVYIPFT